MKQQIAYAIDFVSFLIENLKNIDEVNSIILFGSVAREESGKESDIDLFIDMVASGSLENEIKHLRDSFFNSRKFTQYWKPLGINSDINIIVDKLNQWKLKDSLPGNAVILYQKYLSRTEAGEYKAILSWKNIKPNSRRVFLSRKLFGYMHYKRKYLGLMQKFEGETLGSGAIMIPLKYLNTFIKLFRAMKVSVKIQRIFAQAE